MVSQGLPRRLTVRHAAVGVFGHVHDCEDDLVRVLKVEADELVGMADGGFPDGTFQCLLRRGRVGQEP